MTLKKQKKRIWMPVKRAEKFAHKCEKRNKTRQAKNQKVMRDDNF